MAPFFKDDVEVLNYALTLEHLEAAFYTMAVASGKLTGKNLAYFTIIRDDEVAHVNAISQGLSQAGATPVKPRASYDFAKLGDMTTQAGLLKIAALLEATGVGAYNGAAREITNKTILGRGRVDRGGRGAAHRPAERAGRPERQPGPQRLREGDQARRTSSPPSARSSAPPSSRRGTTRPLER